jgi:hypothetical protein
MQKRETVGVDESDFGEKPSVGGLAGFPTSGARSRRPVVAHLAFEPEHHRAVNVRRLNDLITLTGAGNEVPPSELV